MSDPGHCVSIGLTPYRRRSRRGRLWPRESYPLQWQDCRDGRAWHLPVSMRYGLGKQPSPLGTGMVNGLKTQYDRAGHSELLCVSDPWCRPIKVGRCCTRAYTEARCADSSLECMRPAVPQDRRFIRRREPHFA